MAVIGRLRNEAPSKLQVLNEAFKFQNYLMNIVSNEKYFPKRYRWAFTYKIMNNVNEIQEEIVIANSIEVKDVKTFEKRKEHQQRALSLLDVNLSYLMSITMSEQVKIQESTSKTWAASIFNIKRLLKAWMKGDECKFENLEFQGNN